MFRKENAIGILLLALCGVAAAILITAIITGRPPTVPEFLRVPVMVIGIGLMIVLFWQRFGSRFKR